MSLLFWLPFGTGSLYSIRKEMKNPVGWGLPISVLTTTSILHTFKAVANENEFSVKQLKQLPGNFVAATIFQGSIFCLGHLFTKMAYPVLKDTVKE
jgi:hypothetical protein